MFFSRSCSPQLEGFFLNESLLKDIYESLVYVYTLVYLYRYIYIVFICFCKVESLHYVYIFTRVGSDIRWSSAAAYKPMFNDMFGQEKTLLLMMIQSCGFACKITGSTANPQLTLVTFDLVQASTRSTRTCQTLAGGCIKNAIDSQRVFQNGGRSGVDPNTANVLIWRDFPCDSALFGLVVYVI